MSAAGPDDLIDLAEAWAAVKRERLADLLRRDPRELSPRDRARRRQVERHGEPWPAEGAEDADESVESPADPPCPDPVPMEV